MARDLAAALLTEFTAAALRPIAFVEVEMSTGEFVRVWSGIGEREWGGETYQGVGGLGRIASPIEESGQVNASGVTFELSGIPSALIQPSLPYLRQGLPCRLWVVAMTEAGALVGDPDVPFYVGLTDALDIADSGDESTISLHTENRLIDLERPRVRRFTTEDQRLTDPDDKGFEFVPGLQDVQIQWGRS